VSIASLGVAIPVDPQVAAVADDGSAARAGIKPGDRLVAANFVVPGENDLEEPVPLSSKGASWAGIMEAIQRYPDGTRLRLTVEADPGKPREIDVDTVEADDLYVVERGFTFEPIFRMVKATSFSEAFRRGFQKAQDDLGLVYVFLAKLWSGDISPRNFGGPIMIASEAARSAEEGFSRLLLFLTMLSANLAVVNFLPIPVLDGGHMVFLLYELIRRKPPSEAVVAGLSYLGLALILSLMMFVFGLDLGLIPRK
jgi:regulator of sigma E protease